MCRIKIGVKGGYRDGLVIKMSYEDEGLKAVVFGLQCI